MPESAPSDVSGDEALDDFYAALLDDDPESLYERAPCGYLSTTLDGTIVKVNQTFLTLTGYERTQLVGRRTFSQLLNAGGRIYHDTHYAPMLQMQGSAREIALDVVRADGVLLPVLVNAVVERDRSGGVALIRAAVFDATHRRAYELELLQAKQRAEESEARARELARTLQQTLIPPHPPSVPGLDVAAAYRPAGAGDEVGGDFYDVFETSRGEWFVAVGDVQGKGVDAAVITALARHTIRAVAVREESPATVLRVLNDVLFFNHASSRFCTVVLSKVVCTGGGCDLTVAVAGHPSPLKLVPGASPVGIGRAGDLLGLFEGAEVADEPFSLDPGAEILFYTDGVTEARSAAGWFGDAMLQESMTVHSGSAQSLVDGILGDVLDFQGGVPRDDIALVSLRVPDATRSR